MPKGCETHAGWFILHLDTRTNTGVRRHKCTAVTICCWTSMVESMLRHIAAVLHADACITNRWQL